jgi:cytoskeleton protein RodZ
MTSIGETLRRERVKRNLDLNRISNELKISSRLLEAIEAERFDKLPGGVFVKSFVLQYARLLELDEDDIASELQRMLDPQPALAQVAESVKPEGDIPLPRVKGWEMVGDQGWRWTSSLPALALVVVVMLVCSLVYSWWQRTRHAGPAHEVAAVPAQAIPAPQTPPADRARPTAPTAVPAPAPRPSSPKETGAERFAAAAAAGPNASAVRVQLIAQEPVWVSVQADGKLIFSDTLDTGQSRNVEAGSTVRLRLGNAGGIEIALNGKPIGPVGPKGQVRTLQLTSGGFQIVSDPPKSAAPVEE